MIITHTYTEFSDWFFLKLHTLLEEKDIVKIALPGWHSLDNWYVSMLWDGENWRKIGLSRLRWCLVDERCVSIESPDRNDSYIWEAFLQPLGVEKRHVLCLWMEEINALEYTEIVGVPDMAIFWLWPDGHIASLFPHHPALLAQTEGYIHISDAPKMPPKRITLTVPTLQKIRYAALFVVGSEKQDAFENLLDPQKSPAYCPAKFLRLDIIFRQ